MQSCILQEVVLNDDNTTTPLETFYFYDDYVCYGDFDSYLGADKCRRELEEAHKSAADCRKKLEEIRKKKTNKSIPLLRKVISYDEGQTLDTLDDELYSFDGTTLHPYSPPGSGWEPK